METEFDTPAYLGITQVRTGWMEAVWPLAASGLRSAVEYGCGVGVFSAFLLTKGLSVHGVDLQADNVTEARARHPLATYTQLDFDTCSESDFCAIPLADLGFAFGLLYHLRSPLVTLQRICERTRHTVMIETRTAVGSGNFLKLFEEKTGAAHNTARIVSVPSLDALVNTLHESGFEAVYRPTTQPQHSEWAASECREGLRHNLIAMREVGAAPWEPLSPSAVASKWI